MPLSEFEYARLHKVASELIEELRPSVHMRDKLDVGFRIEGQSIVIFEIRPRWDKPDEKMEHMVAKATFVKTKRVWRVFWMRGDLQWHRYDPLPEVTDLESFFRTVKEDSYCCFYG